MFLREKGRKRRRSRAGKRRATRGESKGANRGASNFGGDEILAGTMGHPGRRQTELDSYLSLPRRRDWGLFWSVLRWPLPFFFLVSLVTLGGPAAPTSAAQPPRYRPTQLMTMNDDDERS